VAPSGHTTVVGVIGDPVAHSLSPAIHNAAFAALGMDWVFVAFPVGTGEVHHAVDGVRALGIRGLSVTMPHKAAVLDAVDELTPTAAALGAVNCISRSPQGTLVGENTDGAGFLGGLRADFGFDPVGTRCVVLGAGGAARAVVLALAGAGASTVQVVNRTAATAAVAAALAGPAGSVADPGAVAGADLVVNATPVGMGGDDGLPCDPALLGPSQVVAELVYHPAETPFMVAARDRGARTANGLSMLVHQAAVAYTLWTGRPAPVEAMAAGARAGLGS
jgi:shikimate dehydrogenase